MLDEKALKSKTELIVQAAIIAGAIIYGSGFLALAMHHAQFGIPQFSLLRPRIFSAGVIFVVLASIPVIEAFKIYFDRSPTLNSPLISQPSSIAASLDEIAKDLKSFLKEIPSLFYVVANTGIFVRLFMVDSAGLTQNYGKWVLFCIFIPPVIFASQKVKTWNRKINFLFSASMVISTGFCLFQIKDITLWALVIWFLWLAYVTFEANVTLKEPRKLKFFNWARAIISTLATVGAFGAFLYPHIPTAYCGGAPVPATFQFEKQSPIGTTLQTKVWLLDETDAGFYFIQSKDSKKAVFIPRSTVNAVYYGE